MLVLLVRIDIVDREADDGVFFVLGLAALVDRGEADSVGEVPTSATGERGAEHSRVSEGCCSGINSFSVCETAVDSGS